MKCLRKYTWVKLYRECLPEGKGLLGYWAKLAARAAYRKGYGLYCGHRNPVTAGMWTGGIVGLKSILGVKRRDRAFWIIHELENMGYLKFSLDMEDETPDAFYLSDLKIMMEQVQARACGTVAKGLRCLELQTEGYDSKEIGERMGEKPATVRLWMTRGRRFLREQPEFKQYIKEVTA